MQLVLIAIEADVELAASEIEVNLPRQLIGTMVRGAIEVVNLDGAMQTDILFAAGRARDAAKALTPEIMGCDPGEGMGLRASRMPRDWQTVREAAMARAMADGVGQRFKDAVADFDATPAEIVAAMA